jgi:ribonuclease BN (tRNA processing enzyme)
MRLTVLGCGPAAAQPDTAASGLLVETDDGALLLDCGQGVAAQLVARLDPGALTAVVVGHMHADHFIDLSALRYRFPWAGRPERRLPVFLPPGGIARFGELAAVVSERPGFFDDAFEIAEYDPADRLELGGLSVAFVPGDHYVPAWGVELTAPDGSRIVYAGDTGPNPELVRRASGADLLVCEATLASATEDDPARRGHLALEETLEHARSAGVGRLLVTHYPSSLRAGMEARIARGAEPATVARPGLSVSVGGANSDAAVEVGYSRPGRPSR